jgi:hypothetical protein
MYRSSIDTVGSGELPDYVYYNADIINNTTNDQTNNIANKDPQIRFNETRDTAIIKDASQYYFSIIRFTMDGANKDLPLFIPQIQENTGQTNVNLTEYSMAYPLTFTYTPNGGGGGNQVLSVLPVPRFIQYVTETQNLQSAPSPRSLANPMFKGLWSNVRQYAQGDIVSLISTPAQTLYNTRYNSFLGPFYTPITPPAYSPTNTYVAGQAVLFNNVMYIANAAVPQSTPPPGALWTVGPPVGTSPSTLGSYWVPVDNANGNTQDLSSRYYWVYTYEAWLGDVNRTIYNPADNAGVAGAGFAWTCCWGDLYEGIYQALNVANRADFLLIYPTLGAFSGSVPPAVPAAGYFGLIPPNIQYSGAPTNLFSINFNSAIFPPLVGATAAVTSGLVGAVCRTFFNSNMFGLFSNFKNIYWNTTSTSAPAPFPGVSAPPGYVNEILVVNQFYKNVVSLSATTVNNTQLSQYPYWVVTQDFQSNDSLWSPVGSIVFTSTLLPVKAEATGAPVVLGDGNLGFSAPTVQSAFQPIITDISLDTSSGGAAAYRQFIYYAPSAEYRLTDFSASHQDIRNIDIQVYWKNRLDNQLYPINMFNLTNVSIKVMFKKKQMGSDK